MEKPNITVEDIGKFFTTDGKRIWQLVAFKPEPQVTMQQVSGTEEMKEGDLSEFKDFVRLLPEVKPPGSPKRKYDRKAKPESAFSITQVIGTREIIARKKALIESVHLDTAGITL